MRAGISPPRSRPAGNARMCDGFSLRPIGSTVRRPPTAPCFVPLMKCGATTNRSTAPTRRGVFSIYYSAFNSEEQLRRVLGILPPTDQHRDHPRPVLRFRFRRGARALRDATVALLQEDAGLRDEALATWRTVRAELPREATCGWASARMRRSRACPARIAAAADAERECSRPVSAQSGRQGARVAEQQPRLMGNQSTGGIAVNGLREVKPLREFAAERAQVLEMLLAFDAFRHDIHREIVSERDDDADHLGARFVRTDAADERAIDLHRVHVELVQVAERRVAGAEVVHAPLDANLLQSRQRRLRGAHVADAGALGDLELQV